MGPQRQAAGLRIAGVVPCRFINEIAMGVDGLEGGVRTQLQSVAARMRGVVRSPMSPEMLQFFETLFADLDRAILDWASERIAPTDMPAGEFLVLRRA